ncbi:hypothetical protein PRNP1_002181 [Phytophthora ramorum]
MAWGNRWGGGSWGDRYYEEEQQYDTTQPTEEEVFKKGRWPFGVKGEAEDIPLPKDAVCAQLSSVLARAEDQAGEFSFGGQAETLPAVPGLFVRGVGTIALPLCKAQAEELITKCKKSPFGQKLSTKMDEKVRKSWELAPDQVQIKNPLWKAGMDTLSEIIAGRLGYKGVSMQCKLYKLLLYGEGGHFVKHQDTEKEDGMVATLVVQPPSEHKGGNLVVYRGGKAVQRHDFGKKDGTAAYLSHYAVHYADAEHALEKVTKGYRLALVFSICLPPNMHHLIRNHDIPLSEELAAAMGRLNSDTDSFALMFSHEYTEQSITDLGTRALKGIDRARVEALEEANAILPDEKKLYFYLAELTLDANFYDTGGDWEESERDELINWYSTSGESLGSGMDEIELNFLNPGRESLAEWWEGHKNISFEGYLGNEEATRLTEYVDYATFACPVVQCVEKSLKCINASGARVALQTEQSIDSAVLGTLMDAAASGSLCGPRDPWSHVISKVSDCAKC